MDMELEDDETAKELATKTSQMRDAVLLVLRSKTASELSGPDGMKKLGADLLDKANTILKSGRALSIYFTEFTIQ
jgi:flagellar FliL protein